MSSTACNLLGPGASCTLTQFLALLAADSLADCDRRTIREYSATCHHWERLTGDPPLAAIRPEDVAAFRRGLLEAAETAERPARLADPQLFLFDPAPPRPVPCTRPLSRPTVNKHLRHLRRMLRLAAPAGAGNPDGLGWIAWTPWIKSVRQDRPGPRPPHDDVLASIWQRTAEATYPRVDGIRAAAWWQALIVAAVTTGFRREALLGLSWEHIDLRAGEIFLPAPLDKRNQQRLKPMHSLLARHLLRIRSGEGRVWPWPHSAATWYRQWRRLQAAGRGIKFHALKQACGTRLAASGANVWQIQAMLDHANLITSRHYIEAAQDGLRTSIERMPLPAIFGSDGMDGDEDGPPAVVGAG